MPEPVSEPAAEKKKSDKVLIIAVGVAFLVFVSLGFLALRQYLSSRSLPSPSRLERAQIQVGEEEVGETELPTLSPEEKEIISKLENHVVVIEDQSFDPKDLTIKPHDQVEWQNEDGETYQIKGDDWGDVPIEPGESFTQAFATPGTYTYGCLLHPDLSGTIIVK